jgi:uncharacterized protein YfeS
VAPLTVRNPMKILIILPFLFVISAYGQDASYADSAHVVKLNYTLTHHAGAKDYYPTFENAHPLAKEIMKDDFYFSPIEETAPFGSDDGADTYAGFKDWRISNREVSPKVFLSEQLKKWEYPVFDLYETDAEKLKSYLKQSDIYIQFMAGIDAAIVSVAFGQLYLEGTIDKEYKQLAMIAIKRELMPGILARREDPNQRRQQILEKMLHALELVK